MHELTKEGKEEVGVPEFCGMILFLTPLQTGWGHTPCLSKGFERKSPLSYLLVLAAFLNILVQMIDKERRFVFEVIWPGTQQSWTFLHFAPRDTKS